MNIKKYPATVIVHWPSGPLAACDKHANALIGISKILGSHVVATKLEEEADCTNCRNEDTEGVNKNDL